MIHITIDSKSFEFETPVTILEAATSAGIWIPTLCYNDKLKAYGGCRVCLVELPGKPVLSPACSTEIADGMEVITNSERVREARKFIAELLLSRCPNSPELIDIALKIGVDPNKKDELDIVGKYLLERAVPPFETNCILCGLCVRVCAEVTERHALSFSERGIVRRIKTPFEKVADTCIGCGSCAYVCPTNTITIEEA
jgi:bidirectional [NiFe] hydrogenase diaphorase subunit